MTYLQRVFVQMCLPNQDFHKCAWQIICQIPQIVEVWYKPSSWLLQCQTLFFTVKFSTFIINFIFIFLLLEMRAKFELSQTQFPTTPHRQTGLWTMHNFSIYCFYLLFITNLLGSIEGKTSTNAIKFECLKNLK